MFKLLIAVFLQFFHVGVFSFGGGYATLPFLYDIAENYNWYSTSQLTDMLAISSVTPGPIGVNMATFAGFATSGVLGAIIATTAIMLPSFIIVTIVAKFLDKFKTNLYVQSCIKTIKPAGCGLLTVVGLKLVFNSSLHWVGFVVLACLIIASIKNRRDPLFYLGISALAGFVLGLFNLTNI